MDEPVKRSRRIYEDISLKLTEKINSGEFPDGCILPSERELAEMFGASRTAVREAMLSLQSSGQISVRPRSRARVTLLNNTSFFNQLSASAQNLLARPNGVADLQEVRMFLECGLARYAACYASPKEIDKLTVALEQNKKAIADPDLFIKTDMDFHGILAEIPGNPIIAACNSALAGWLMSQRTVRVKGAFKIAYQGHEKIYQAIVARDVEAADKTMADHLKAVSEFYWKGRAAKAGTLEVVV
ncbi:MAG: FCD domain-containing protein [Sterolibacterium sp.]|nr:FCD domain-containing protein [Sterolibacterium sp.]